MKERDPLGRESGEEDMKNESVKKTKWEREGDGAETELIEGQKDKERLTEK